LIDVYKGKKLLRKPIFILLLSEVQKFVSIN